MIRLLEFDLLARTELLTYLVASQLAMRHKTGRWLTTEHVVESTHLWLQLNGYEADWLQRVSLACRAQYLAERGTWASQRRPDAKTVAGAFFSGVRLDFKSPAVIEIFIACAANLPGLIRFLGTSRIA
ncbi:glutamine amidotransferase-like uncharacterized protein [Paraburkholderia sp. GAS348]|uniref:Uncharacterized protein n=1 Tax=Paraburkholderia phytofirmans OLGA172 TaxID=1417228 RepID=A0A160FS50_9BURK|nr:hypothetical protein [Paraburkholderia phytofirmans]ANB75634.1 hypothetical protein AYM40_25155 [Paraburkholderia phytofirmans OLGA172]